VSEPVSGPLKVSGPVVQPGSGVGQILRSYFFWTHSRGSFPYDVMVTLILLFIFVTPHLWDYGARPSPIATLEHPIQIVSDGGHGMIITVPAVDVKVAPGATEGQVKKALRTAIEPVTGDAVFVERWRTVTDAHGNVSWKIWAHR
jgi:hypothetical protein